MTFNADKWVTSREPSLCGGGACVEVFWAGRAVNVRDTKLDPLLSPVLRFEVWQWRELLAAIVRNVTHPAVSVGDDGTVRLGVEHLHGDESLTFTEQEWSDFARGVRDGWYEIHLLQFYAAHGLAVRGIGATARLSGPESPGRGGDEGRTAGSVSADRSGGVAAGTVSGGRSRGSAVPVAAELAEDGDYIRSYYRVPAHVGGRITFTWMGRKEGTIVGFDGAYLLVRFDGEEAIDPLSRLHPTWKVEYLQLPTAAELGPLDDELDLLNSPAGRDLSGNPREGFPDAVATTGRPGTEPPAETIPGKRGRGSDADVQPEGVRTAESPGWRPDAATGAGEAGAASSRPAPVAAPLLNSPAGRPVDASTGEVVLSLADRPGSDAAGTGVPPDLVPAAQLDDVLAEVAEERERQNQKWGEQNHADGTGGVTLRRWAEQDRAICQEAFRKGVGTWRHILTEEVSEALAEDDPAKLRAELVQVAAVAAQWVQAIDRREWARAVAPLVPTDGAP